MRKLLLLVPVLALAACANTQDKPAEVKVTPVASLTMDASATIVGKVTRVGTKTFSLRDNTGEIKVSVDTAALKKIKKGNMVQVTGALDKKKRTMKEFDAKSIKVMGGK